MVAIRSALLNSYGVLHAFSTRRGGVSKGEFTSLNLGRALGDDERCVDANLQIFCDDLGVARECLHAQKQVHGDRVRTVAETQTAEDTASVEGDALIALVAGVAVAIRTADCVPVLLAHPQSGAVAAVHVGWRGAVAGIVPKTIASMNAPAMEILCAIGPHIRVESFEIGEEVAAEIDRAAHPTFAVLRRAGLKPHGDLSALVIAQSVRAGLLSSHVDDLGECTFEGSATYFSHRRDQGKTGRQLSAIVAG